MAEHYSGMKEEIWQMIIDYLREEELISDEVEEPIESVTALR